MSTLGTIALVIVGGSILLLLIHRGLSGWWHRKVGQNVGAFSRESNRRGEIVLWPKDDSLPTRVASYGPDGQSFYRARSWPIGMSFAVLVALSVIGYTIYLLVR